jgi:hypothetical protein
LFTKNSYSRRASSPQVSRPVRREDWASQARFDVRQLGYIDLVLRERRSLEAALGELVAKYNRSSYKNPELARMIRQLKAEILQRQSAAKPPKN